MDQTAGALVVPVTQRSMSDQATTALMEACYRAYLAEDNKAAVLQHVLSTAAIYLVRVAH